MNLKITKKLHEELPELKFEEYVFGSHLHGISNENSDYDYVRVIGDGLYKHFESLAKYLPNIHSWQYDDVENKTQYVWMTQTQFYRNLFSGDGNMIADIVLMSGKFPDPLFLCRTYKIIKGYLGVAKRDLKLHGHKTKSEKKIFHAMRSLYMAKCLMNNYLPNTQDIINLKLGSVEPSHVEGLFDKESKYRKKLNEMLENKEIDMYPLFMESNELIQLMVNSNNVKEFKY